MEQNNETETPQKEKTPFLKWNGEFNFGNLLTILVIVIAVFGLYYQKRIVETKVDDLQTVVAKLEEEKLNREWQGLQGDEKALNSFSYNLGYTVDQFRATGQIINYEFEFILTEFNELIDLSLKRKDLTQGERKKLELLKERNLNKKDVFLNADIYESRITEFEEKNAPKKESYKSIEEYNIARTIYNDTLQKHINILKHLLDSFLTQPVKKLSSMNLNFLNYKRKTNRKL